MGTPKSITIRCAYCNYHLGPASEKVLECPVCHKIVVLDSALSVPGVIPETISPLQVGTTGVYKEEKFELTGRYYYRDLNSYTNSWCMRFPSREHRWLVESYGSYWILENQDVKINRNALSGLKAGNELKFSEGLFTVLSIDKFLKILREGDPSPRNIETPLYSISFGRNMTRITIEISKDQSIEYFKGDTYSLDQLALKNTRF